jgi:hypothetical protein
MSEEEIRELVRGEIARYDGQRRTRWTALVRAVRQAVLMVLAAIETHEDMPRSVAPRRNGEVGMRNGER